MISEIAMEPSYGCLKLRFETITGTDDGNLNLHQPST